MRAAAEQVEHEDEYEAECECEEVQVIATARTPAAMRIASGIRNTDVQCAKTFVHPSELAYARHHGPSCHAPANLALCHEPLTIELSSIPVSLDARNLPPKLHQNCLRYQVTGVRVPRYHLPTLPRYRASSWPLRPSPSILDSQCPIPNTDILLIHSSSPSSSAGSRLPPRRRRTNRSD